MNRPAPKNVRRRFLVAFGQAIHVAWPVLSAILVIELVLGLLEGWTIGDAVYFAFITGLTIGYARYRAAPDVHARAGRCDRLLRLTLDRPCGRDRGLRDAPIPHGRQHEVMLVQWGAAEAVLQHCTASR
jgi:hypothetical protein